MIIENMSLQEYHSMPDSISKSGLEMILRSPAHYKNRDAFSGTRATVIGSAVHAAVLEPHIFAREYVLLDGVSDRRAKEFKDAVKARGDDDFVLVEHEAITVRGTANSVSRNKEASKILTAPGRAELSVITTDPVTGLTVRIRPDWITNDGRMVDIKTTVDARSAQFTRSIINYKYHMQAALYMDAWKWETGENTDFSFLALEKARPYANKMYRLDALAIDVGRSMYRTAMQIYAECVEKDRWPGYSGEIEVLGLPEWAFDCDDVEIGGDDE